jgi:ABC-type nitrate/sulfonate/bicarbonate transport system substrate-binding protein
MTRPASQNPLVSRQRFLAGAGAAAAAVALRPARVLAQARALKVGYFPGVGTLPLWAAIELGIFAQAGLHVTALPTPASIELFGAMDRAELDIAHTSIDNPIAYNAGVQQRAQGLLAGAFDATLVTPPFDVQANAKGFTTLARVTDIVGPYQGISLVARRAWLAVNRPAAVTYVRAFRAALNRVATDRASAVAILMRNTKVDEPTANASYDAAFGPQGGIHRDAALDLAGIRTVLELRAKYAPPGGGSAPELYVDTTILRDASA